MRSSTRPVSRPVALFWFVVLLALAYGLFNYTSEHRGWILTSIAYVSAFLALGAFLEVIRWRGADASEESGNAQEKLTDQESDLIGEYARLLEGQEGKIIRRESDLPVPKEALRTILAKARRDPIYCLDLQSLDRCLKALDTFIPDDEHESTKSFVEQSLKLIFEHKDEQSFTELYERASLSQKKAIGAVLRIGGGGQTDRYQNRACCTNPEMSFPTPA